MKRRAALAAIGIAGLPTAGCLQALGRDGRSDACSDGTHFSLQRATVPHGSNEFSTSVRSLPHAARTVVTHALASETGEATSRGYYAPRTAEEYVVTESEAYYRVETTDFDAAEAPGYEYSVDIGVDESAPPNTSRIHSFAELPAHDRESLRSAVGNPHLLHAPHYSFSVVFAYGTEQRRHRSKFMPETERYDLRWNDVVLRLSFDEKRTVEITSTTVATERVAESSEEFFRYMCREHGKILGPLTSRQRDIVTQAIEGTYTECRPYSDAFSDLRGHLTTEGSRHGLLARYGGSWYFVHLSG